MGWFEDERRRDEAIREARRQSNEEAVQSAFIRGFKPQLELVRVEFDDNPLPPPMASTHERGVFVEPGTPAGLVVLTGYDSRGLRRFRHEMLEIDVEPETIPRLEKWLDRKDPVRTLQVI